MGPGGVSLGGGGCGYGAAGAVMGTSVFLLVRCQPRAELSAGAPQPSPRVPSSALCPPRSVSPCSTPTAGCPRRWMSSTTSAHLLRWTTRSSGCSTMCDWQPRGAAGSSALKLCRYPATSVCSAPFSLLGILTGLSLPGSIVRLQQCRVGWDWGAAHVFTAGARGGGGVGSRRRAVRGCYCPECPPWGLSALCGHGENGSLGVAVVGVWRSQGVQGVGLKSRWVLLLGRGKALCPWRARAPLALPRCPQGFSAALPAAPPAGDGGSGGRSRWRGEPGWGGGSQSRLPPGGTAQRRGDRRCRCSRRAHPALPVPVGAHHELRSRSLPGAPALPQVSPAPPLGSPGGGCGGPAPCPGSCPAWSCGM